MSCCICCWCSCHACGAGVKLDPLWAASSCSGNSCSCPPGTMFASIFFSESHVTCCGLSWGNSYYLTHRAPTCLLVLMLALHYPYQQKAGVKSDSLKMSMLYGYIMDMLLAYCLCWLFFKYKIPPGVFWLTPQSTICKILSFAMSAGAPRPLQSPTRFQAKLQLWISTNQQNNTWASHFINTTMTWKTWIETCFQLLKQEIVLNDLTFDHLHLFCIISVGFQFTIISILSIWNPVSLSSILRLFMLM